MTGFEAYLLARAYTNKAIEGGGSLKGAACQIKSIEPITGGNRVTFEWEDNQGVVSTDTMDVMNGQDGSDGTDGVGIVSITYKSEDAQGNYIYTVALSDSTSYDITCPKGAKGDTGATGATGADGQDGADGVGIASITKTGTSGLVDTYTITYTNGTTSTFTVTNGQDGNSNEFIGTLAEWNAKTTAQKKEYDTYQITDDYSEALLPNYSTTEQKIGQKWIDGKDIYFKTYQTTTTPNVDNYIDLTSANIDKIISNDGTFFIDASGNQAVAQYFNSSDDRLQMYYDVANKRIVIRSVRSVITVYVTLKYTKTA